MKKLFLLVLLLLLAMPLATSAAVMESGDSYILPGNEIVRDNLYAAGGTVHLSGAVDGDAMIAGGSLTVSNTVSEDLLAVGGTIVILGNVGEDARLAGGNVLLTGEVGGELVAAGGTVTVAPSSKVRGDAIVMGGQVVLDGTYEGNVDVQGEEVIISGRISGNVSGEMESLTIADGAVISGSLVYKSPKEAKVADGAVILGETIHDSSAVGGIVPTDPSAKLKEAKRALGAAFAALAILRYLAALAAALLLTLWFTKRSQDLVVSSMKGFGHNFLVGLAVMIASPIVLILLLLTGVGAVLSILGGAVFVMMLTVSSVFAGVILGVYIRRVWIKSEKVPADWKSVLLGVTLLHLICIVPILGMLFKMVLMLGVLGAVSTMFYAHLRPKSGR